MPSTLTLAILVSLALYTLNTLTSFARNLAAAKRSGIPYLIVPVCQITRLWTLTRLLFAQVWRKFLPTSWTNPYLEVTLEWGWNLRHDVFKRLGTDTFLTVSPGRNLLFTADANVVNQITTRREDFPKATWVYQKLKLYGDSVITTEGQIWRQHRKIVSPPFSEKNNHLVWDETLEQCQAMLRSWFDGDTTKKETRTIRTIADDAMRLSLHVISRAGFGVHLKWPEIHGVHANVHAEKDQQRLPTSAEVPSGHVMSYANALGSVLHNVLWLVVLPQFLLKYLPFKKTKEVYTAYVEWGNYMNEMFQQKKALILKGEEGDTLDLMIALVKGAGITKESLQGKSPVAQTLTDREILGNAFVLLLAGHETTANSIHFCLVLLAMNIASQRHLQADLDEVFKGRSVSESSYEEVLPKLFSNMAGAVLNEELRYLAPVIAVPKCTLKDTPQNLEVAGKTCTVPEDCYITLIAPAIHRNPNNWPTGPPSNPKKPAHPRFNLDNDLEEFKPERWILNPNAKHSSSMPVQNEDKEASELGVNTAADTSASLYRPPKGAYIPFSEGHRSCVGRRFGQVEILAFLATVFTEYSVELAVDAYASDEEVDEMDERAKYEVWDKARDAVNRQLNEDMQPMLTLQLVKGAIPLRIVKRGSERFNFGVM